MFEIRNLFGGIAVLTLAVVGSAPAQALGKQGTIPFGKLHIPPDHKHLPGNTLQLPLGHKHLPSVKIGAMHIPHQVNIGLAPPVRLHFTTDLKECGTHGGLGGGIVCAALLPKGQAILVWDWSGAFKIDGYRIYRTNIAIPVPAGKQTAGPQITMFALNPGDHNGQCFNVVAYKGAAESS